jgi:hypothetical protein
MPDTAHISANHHKFIHLWALALDSYVICVSFWFHYYWSIDSCLSWSFTTSLLHSTVGTLLPFSLLHSVIRFSTLFYMARGSSSLSGWGEPLTDPKPDQDFDWCMWLRIRWIPIAQPPLQKFSRKWMRSRRMFEFYESSSQTTR